MQIVRWPSFHLGHSATGFLILLNGLSVPSNYRCPVPFFSARNSQHFMLILTLSPVPESVIRCYNMRIRFPSELLCSRPPVDAHPDRHPVPRNCERLFSKRTLRHGTDST